MGVMSIPWTQVAIAWLVLSLFVAVMFSVWFDRCGWRDSEDGHGAQFDGGSWVPDGWRS